jgi:glycosyltransferase involved in cell wall biosynthesis
MPMRHLVMLGTAARGGITTVIDAYRAHGLFERWPIRFVPTHRDTGAGGKLLTALSAALVVAWFLARHRSAVMHVHCALRVSFWRKAVFMSMAMLAGCRVIFHLHGGGFADFYESECNELARRIIRFFLDRAACIIVLSERWRVWVTGVSANCRVVCVPNPGPVLEDFPSSGRENLVLFLGRLERAKGVFDLVEAVARVRKHVPDIRLVCAGDGDRESVAQFAQELHIHDALGLPGWIGPEEKRSLLGRAAVCVLPSYAEGLPMVLLEGMAAGVPVVATDVGGIPDLVTDGVNGLLYAPGDTDALERLLRKLLHDAALRRRMGTAARESVRLRFDAGRVIAQLESVYASLGLTPTARPPADAPAAGRLREAA